MGRRILKSLRRSRGKPFEVQIEIDDGLPRADEATVSISFTKAKDVTSDDKSQVVDEKAEESPTAQASIETQKQHQVYVPPKIWVEQFDSDSDDDVQQNACWLGGTSNRRKDRRNEIAYAVKRQEERSDQPNGFCGIFDCDVGFFEEPHVREMKQLDFLDYYDPVISERPKRSQRSKRESSPETVVTSVLSDSSGSFDSEIHSVTDSETEYQTELERDKQEGVEYTLDDMNSAYWMMTAKTKDVDLERKDKKKLRKRNLLKRVTGRKPRREKETTTAAGPEKIDYDDHKLTSTESSSVTGDTTVISIRHVVPDRSVEALHSEPVESRHFAKDDEPPMDLPSQAVDDSIISKGELLHEEVQASLESRCRKHEWRVDDDTPKNDLLDEDHPMNEVEQMPPKLGMRAIDGVTRNPSKPTLRASQGHAYESLGMGDGDSVSDDDTDWKWKISVPQPNPPDFLNQVVNAVDAGIKLFAFPEIQQPRKRRSKKRVTFAPDVKFNDQYDDHDYSLDYSYGDPEFGGDSFDEEMHYSYTTEDDEESEDEEAFFDDEPSPKMKSTDSPKEHEPPDPSTSSFDEFDSPEPKTGSCESDDDNSFDENELSESNVEPCKYDDDNRSADDEILDFDDPVDPVCQMSSESGFEYLEIDAGGEEVADDESLLDYTTIEEMVLERAAFPFDPTMRSHEPMLRGTHERDDIERPVSEAKLMRFDEGVTLDEDDATDEPIVKGSPSPGNSASQSRTESSMEPAESPEPLGGSEGTSTSTDLAELNALFVDKNNGFKLVTRPLKPPRLLKDSETYRSTDVECNAYADQVIPNKNSAEIDLVERYLSISACQSDESAEVIDANISQSYQDILSVTESQSVDPIALNLQTSGEMDDASEETSLYCPVVAENDNVATDISYANETHHGSMEENTDLKDWLHQPETRQSPSIENTFEKNIDVVREGWPSSHSTSEWKSVGDSEAFADKFRPPEKSEAKEERFTSPTRYQIVKSYQKNRISDKKESLKLSLQGFARSKDVSSDWANFNNAPFQDLEEAPFDEV